MALMSNFQAEVIWTINTALGVSVYARRPSNRRLFLAVACSACTFLAPFLGCSAGRCLWQREFDLNRRSADEVVEALRHYREEHGAYPATLGELEVPVGVTLQRGRHGHRLEYRRTEKGASWSNMITDGIGIATTRMKQNGRVSIDLEARRIRPMAVVH